MFLEHHGGESGDAGNVWWSFEGKLVNIHNIVWYLHKYLSSKSQRSGVVQAVRRETFSEAQGELRKLLLLGIHTFDELAKPLFFVAFSRLCHHCRDFILRSVATFWVMPLVGIYRGRASLLGKNWCFFTIHLNTARSHSARRVPPMHVGH